MNARNAVEKINSALDNEMVVRIEIELFINLNYLEHIQIDIDRDKKIMNICKGSMTTILPSNIRAEIALLNYIKLDNVYIYIGNCNIATELANNLGKAEIGDGA